MNLFLNMQLIVIKERSGTTTVRTHILIALPSGWLIQSRLRGFILSSPEGYPAEYNVEAFVGNIWITMASVTNNEDLRQLVLFSQAVTTTQIRINLTKDGGILPEACILVSAKFIPSTSRKPQPTEHYRPKHRPPLARQVPMQSHRVRVLTKA